MFSKEVITTRQVVQAVFVGIGIGLVGVGCFVLLLVTANERAVAPSTESKVQTAAPAQQTVALYAVQHGAFTTKESATGLITAHPTLNKALVIEVDKTFYVWSALATEKREVALTPAAFMKPLYLESASCAQAETSIIPNLVKDEKALQLNFEQSEFDKLPADWEKTMTTLAPFAKEIDVLRLHSFAFFYEKESCLRVRFDA